MERLRVGVVGVGHLGRHHARVFAGMDGVELVGVVDTRPEQARAVAEPLGIKALTDYQALIDRVDAVSIAVPTSAHLEVARAFLSRGIHTLIEKPLARSTTEGRELLHLAEERGVRFQVGHIERFNPVWEAARPVLPHPRYIDAERQGIYTFRSTDIGVVLDLMIHDIDLILSIVDSPLVSISALGTPVFGGHEDLAQARLTFEDGTVADLSASRASYRPSRKMRLWGLEGYATIDFAAREATVIRPTEELRRGNRDLEGLDRSRPETIRDHLFNRVLEVETIRPESNVEPLAAELNDFLTSIRTGQRPRVSGFDGLQALRIAERVIAGLRTWRHDAASEVPAAPHIRPLPGLRTDTPSLTRAANPPSRPRRPST